MLLDEDVKNYLSETMQLDVPWLIKELEGWPENIRTDVYKYINQVTHVVKADQDLVQIDKLYHEIFSSYENEEYKEELTEIRVVFRHFSGITLPAMKHNVLELYTKQVICGWSPKMNITKELTPNCIKILDEVVRIYRGCDISEYKSGQYGQSWTLNPSKADEFAYEHCANEDWFDKTQRVIVAADIPNSSIYYYSQDNFEEEVIVNTSNLENIVKIS